MVIVKLWGGLGNQLFQYAAAKNLSIHHKTELKFDTGFYESQNLRVYSLKHFHIQENFAAQSEINQLTGYSDSRLPRGLFKLRQSLKPYYRRTVFKKPYVSPFDPNIFKTPQDVYLDGYWQTEKYFKDIEPIIREEFTIRYLLDTTNQEMVDLISSVNSVSLHVRRGDYVSNPETYQHHGVCSLDYYRAAVSRLARSIDDLHLFIFSDDMDWVQQNLQFSHPMTFVIHNGPERDFEDLRLMSACKYHVIANSSFSWWGAWLASFSDKIVIAPKKWFNDPTRYTKDMIPSSWIRM